jgi:nicotinamidase-related amidase
MSITIQFALIIMPRLKLSRLSVVAGVFGLLHFFSSQSSAETMALSLRRLVATDESKSQWEQVTTRASWESSATAVVICDMWDQHWCKGASARVAEMAPRMNQVVGELRRRGVLIIHCPSETMKFYQNTPGRKLAQSAPSAAVKTPLQGWCSLDSVKEPALPIDDSDGGCDDTPQCAQGSPWRRQIATIEIKPGDAITDNAEAYNLMRQRGITNVIIMGVHQNMCVLGRPFSIRQMVYQGQNVVLMRDLTDSMYNSRRKPWVDHFTGNDLMAWHIEEYWCPTITSDQIVGGRPFRFAADTKPPRQFGAPIQSGPRP